MDLSPDVMKINTNTHFIIADGCNLSSESWSNTQLVLRTGHTRGLLVLENSTLLARKTQ